MVSRRELHVKVAAVGGTFDLLHKGHRELLETAFEIGDKVVVGLSDDNFVKKLHKPHRVENYATRELELREYLEKRGFLSRAEILPLSDRYGPSINNGEIEALVVSKRSEAVTSKINELRRSKGLKPLEIISIDMVLAQDTVPISTTRIRRGRIDREGTVLR
jgi:pantetheine-phosphate adenylyltransferase